MAMGKTLSALLLLAGLFSISSPFGAQSIEKAQAPKVPAKCTGWVKDYNGNFAGAGRKVKALSKIYAESTSTYVSSDTTWFNLDFPRDDTVRFYVDTDSCFIFPNNGDSNRVYIRNGWNTTNLRMAVNHSTAVELSSFFTEPIIDGILLKWRTESEYNSLEWRIYEEKIMKKELIGKLPASGNSNSPKEYSFTYPCVEPKTHTFWLGEMSLDGQEEFYGPVNGSPLLQKNTNKGICYPNPFSKEITIHPNCKKEDINAAIYNNSGQIVKRLNGKDFVKWDGTDKYSRKMSSGIYHCKILNKDKSEVYRIILEK